MIAYEIEPDIAERAAANLACYSQVEVRARSGVEDLLPPTPSSSTLPPRIPFAPGSTPSSPAEGSSFPSRPLARPAPCSSRRGPSGTRRGRLGCLRTWRLSLLGGEDAETVRRLDEAFRRGGTERCVRCASVARRETATGCGEGRASSTEPAG